MFESYDAWWLQCPWRLCEQVRPAKALVRPTLSLRNLSSRPTASVIIIIVINTTIIINPHEIVCLLLSLSNHLI